MRQHKASLEKTIQSALRHKKAGTEIAVTILAVEALIASGIAVSSMVENQDQTMIGRLRAGLAHKAFGKQLADAIATLDAIKSAENISVSAVNEVIGGAPYKEDKVVNVISKTIIGGNTGAVVADAVNSVEPTVDALLAMYGVGGSKASPAVESVLNMIKDALRD